MGIVTEAFENIMENSNIITLEMAKIKDDNLDTMVPACIRNRFRIVDDWYCGTGNKTSHKDIESIGAEIDIVGPPDEYICLYFGFIRAFQTSSGTGVKINNQENAQWDFCAFQIEKMIRNNQNNNIETTQRLSQCNLKDSDLNEILFEIQRPRSNINDDTIKQWVKRFNLKDKYTNNILGLCERTLKK